MEPKIEFEKKANGLLWPYYQGQKARSSSSLVKILKKIEYADKQIPERILLIAAKNGELFHQVIQDFFVQTGLEPSYLTSLKASPKLLNKLQKTICFLEKNEQLLSSRCLVGTEKLHYTFYKDTLIATYVDLEFTDFIVELKTNNVIMHESPLTRLSFQIQLLIQHLCTKKDVYLLWSTENKVIFHKFQISDNLLKVLDILIDLVKKTDQYTLLEKRKIVEKILNDYSPCRLF